ncbi:MAG: Nif11-like leader peptide family natural product precursor [Cyanobacteria bacterium]|nr:Nif11-like leader peptide family natural product precursor [Cyanobacteriota bacterium]
MSKSELHRFIDKCRVDSQFRDQLAVLPGPQQILEFIAMNGFNFSDEIRGRFINRWKGVFCCPQADEVGTYCPGLIPAGFKTPVHYAQSTCSSRDLKEEEYDFRSGKKY